MYCYIICDAFSKSNYRIFYVQFVLFTFKDFREMCIEFYIMKYDCKEQQYTSSNTVTLHERWKLCWKQNMNWCRQILSHVFMSIETTHSKRKVLVSCVLSLDICGTLCPAGIFSLVGARCWIIDRVRNVHSVRHAPCWSCILWKPCVLSQPPHLITQRMGDLCTVKRHMCQTAFHSRCILHK